MDLELGSVPRNNDVTLSGSIYVRTPIINTPTYVVMHIGRNKRPRSDGMMQSNSVEMIIEWSA